MHVPGSNALPLVCHLPIPDTVTACRSVWVMPLDHVEEAVAAISPLSWSKPVQAFPALLQSETFGPDPILVWL